MSLTAALLRISARAPVGAERLRCNDIGGDRHYLGSERAGRVAEVDIAAEYDNRLRTAPLAVRPGPSAVLVKSSAQSLRRSAHPHAAPQPPVPNV